MFVTDTQEYIIDTSGLRLSSDLCECLLNSRERSGSVGIFKPCDISARVSQIHKGIPSPSDMHDSCSSRYALC